MLLRVGEVPTLVVSSREAAREVMKTHDIAFASRALSATLRAMTDGGRDMMFAPYGDRWRQLRKIAIVELLSARRVLSFRGVRGEEITTMLRAAAAAASGPFDMRAALATLVADTTMRAAVGDRCKHRDVLLRELDLSVSLAGGFNPADLWPSSRLVGRLSGAVERARACRDSVFAVLDSIIGEHLERMDEGAGHGGGVVENEDLLHVLLKIQKDGSLEIPLDMDAIKLVIFVIITVLIIY
jgi:cytochrome P450